MVTRNNINNPTLLVLYVVALHFSLSNSQQPPADACNAVFLSYNYTGGYPIKPTDPANQPYRFASTLAVLNNGPADLPPWKVHVGFRNGEILVSSTNAALADGTSLPAFVGNGTSLVGVGPTGLKSAIETAGDTDQMQVLVELVGTRFLKGGSADVPPLPANLFLVGEDYSCPAPTFNGTWMYVCCNQISDSGSDITTRDNYEFEPSEKGDLTIMYDVLSTFDTDYWVQVSISNHNPLGRLENWRLSWEWTKGEFIYAMQGAYPTVVDTTDCVFGPQGQHYEEMDFSLALNCQRNPTIMDLPPTLQNDTVLGNLPFCCRNGTILPPTMDQRKSVSAFQLHVYKMPPDLNRTDLNPPTNWRINGTMSSDFQCGSPLPVRPSVLPDPSGLVNRSALGSWRVVCNITKVQQEKPKCCVTFSAFYNDSVVPCSTCACGCSKDNNNPSQTCSVSEPALLLPPEALLLPFENRTKLASKWAKHKELAFPEPIPCGDNCGVSINWHLLSDHNDGWTARITLFNWGETNFADWFTSVELNKAGYGFQEVYSFNGSLLQDSNTTIFMQGLPGNSFLLAETNGRNPKKDPRIPGSQQSVILFSKKKTPGVDVAGGDGFPTRVLFNGEECALPNIRPSSGHKTSATTAIIGLLTAAFFYGYTDTLQLG